MATLQLSLKRKWFDMTSPEENSEDYREVNHYWIKRIMSKKYNEIYPIEQDAIDGILKHIDPKFLVKYHSKPFTTNKMTLGYPKSTDTSRIKEFEHLGIEIREGREEWGAEKGKLYFVIKHGKRISQC